MNEENKMIDCSGPAFPIADVPSFNGPFIPGSRGMTLRDRFAGQALAGMLADPNCVGSTEANASAAYQFADAMIAARKATE